MSRRDYKAIFNTVSKIPQVDKLFSIRTMRLAPEDVIIAIEVSLIDDLNIDTIECLTDNIESKVKQVIPYAKSSKIYVVPNEPSNVDSGRKIFNNCGKKLLLFYPNLVSIIFFRYI